MKSLMVAAVAALGLGGCIAVPGPYYSADPYYYPAPAVGIYAAPVYRDSPYWRGHRYHRHWR